VIPAQSTETIVRNSETSFLAVAALMATVACPVEASMRVEAVSIDWRAENVAAIDVVTFGQRTLGQKPVLITDSATVACVVELCFIGVSQPYDHQPDIRYRFDLYENERRLHTIHLARSGAGVIDGGGFRMYAPAPVRCLVDTYEARAPRLTSRLPTHGSGTRIVRSFRDNLLIWSAAASMLVLIVLWVTIRKARNGGRS
jgi:hypothetical protein